VKELRAADMLLLVNGRVAAVVASRPVRGDTSEAVTACSECSSATFLEVDAIMAAAAAVVARAAAMTVLVYTYMGLVECVSSRGDFVGVPGIGGATEAVGAFIARVGASHVGPSEMSSAGARGGSAAVMNVNVLASSDAVVLVLRAT